MPFSNGYIEPHAHLRDEEWEKKATMDYVVSRGKQEGIELFFDMPNLPRPVISRQRVQERLDVAEKRGVADNYRLYVGLTSDEGQIKEAVEIFRENEKVIGLKMFAGESTGNLAVKTDEEQERVYRTLAAAEYTGVLSVHCESQSVIDAHKGEYNPNEPWTWALARPEEAEYKSVRKQIELAENSKFKGRLQIAHVSYVGTIELIRAALNRGLDIGFELAPHHLLISTEDMVSAGFPDANFWKCNPSIKGPTNRDALLDFFFSLAEGDPLYRRVWLGSDFAPHETEAKLSNNPPSGVADFGLYSELEAEAFRRGLDEKEVADLMYRYRYDNIVEAFKGKIN